ncbi:MAG TPA: glycosyltransferase [Candidatus Acidoferrales bacterium]|nr:glycosyltransferase [Candidatus Acidoferrales bacterium]
MPACCTIDAASLGAAQAVTSAPRGRAWRELSLDGLDVLIVTSGHEATDHRVYAKQACSLRELGAHVTVVGFCDGNGCGPVPILPVPKPGARLRRFLVQPWRCLWRARRLNPDIIHFHDLEMLFALPVAKLWWRRAKFIYDVHEDFGNLMAVRDWLPPSSRPFARIVVNLLEKSLAGMADAVVGVTPPLTEKFANEKKITAFNYNAREFFARAARAARKPKERALDLVHVGTLSSRRALFLAEVLREVHRRKPGARSAIIGAAAEVQATLERAVPEGCLLLGKVPHGEIPSYLGNAKVGIDVHPWLEPHLEVALPVKVCEYMACGCAVVSSSMPVLDRLLEAAGPARKGVALLESEDPARYACEVVRMLEQIDRGADPGSALCDFASEHMSWEQEAGKIARLYRSLVGEPCAI